MNIILYNKITKERIFKKYPRNDLEPIVGLSDDIIVYYVIESDKPNYDNRTHSLKFNEIWSDDIYEDKEHIKICYKNYYLSQLPNEIIIENLNNSVGDWIDNNYPLWEQNKHTGQILRLRLQKEKSEWDEFDIARYEWIINTADWVRSCRLKRDLYEYELMNNIIPDFIWDNRPDKPKILNNKNNKKQ